MYKKFDKNTALQLKIHIMEKYFKPKLFEKIIKEVGSIKERNSLHA